MRHLGTRCTVSPVPARALSSRIRETSAGVNGDVAERMEEQVRLDEHYVRSIEELLVAMPNPADQAATLVQAMNETR
jgi:hypothetical protein